MSRIFAGSVIALIFVVVLSGSASAQAGVETEGTGSPQGVEREVEGEFVLYLSGEVQPGYSFYMEASFGSGGEVLCTTDAAMVAAGYQECAPGDMVIPFVATEGEEFSYRILGNPGSELSQFVVSEGTGVVSEGMVIEGSYAFPQRTTSAPEAPAVVEDQYENEGTSVIEAEPVSMTGTTQEPTVETRVPEKTDVETTAPIASSSDDGLSLPQSGGLPVLLIGGVALLAAGSFLFRRAMR